MAAPTGSSLGLLRYSDIFVAVVVITIIIMMIIPLPTLLVDIMLTFNITFSLLVLLLAMNTLHPLDFSVFPSLLLIATLFRLALNVSTTRLILLEGYAGRVILSFGQFVVGGNPVVGFIIFLILIIIQFIVITRGAERVSEVAARFTLDAMPGKQMSIDADLNAGIITEEEARAKRLEVRREADFYGAMDGASKFVKGDAIAGIIITLINIGGGFIIGIVQQGLSWDMALQKYTLLTVGDGLVSQIPALLISTATGIIVTRSASESNLGQELTGQLLSQPRVLMVATVVLLLLGLVPGLPGIPFFVLAGFTGFLAYTLTTAPVDRGEEVEVPQQEERGDLYLTQRDMTALLQVDPLEIELGYALVPLADPQQGGDLLERIVLLRKQLALELGFLVPTVRVRDNMQLAPNEYSISIRGLQAAGGELLPGYLLAMRPEEEGKEMDGIPTREPTFGLPALWIPEERRQEAERANYTVVDLPAVLATHLTEVIKEHIHELLGRQEVKTLLDSLRESHPAVVDELVPTILGLGQVQRILANLLRERVSIRDLVTILETLADYGPLTKDTDILTEYVRQALARQISQQYRPESGPLPVLTLDPRLEELLRNALQKTDYGNYLALAPQEAEKLFRAVEDEFQGAVDRGYQPVLLCSPVIRFYLRRFLEKQFPRLPVLSYNELEADLEVQVIGRVGIL
ncbi:MAG: flagellar biosynthesis protein FlhA [bacterium]|nr:flagellar biosynthesis protein FlhA [Bacillota bacterium]HHW54365.1 flagellar biosynthesis protein FlhA [Bacillota bacterium]